MNLFRYAVKNKVTTALVFIAFAIFGIFSVANLPVALLPDFDANVVMVYSAYVGANASDVETNLTKVLENGLNSVEDLKDMTTQSKENYSILILEFEYGVDIDEAMNNVRDKLDLVSQSLPDAATTPVLFKFSLDDMPILILSATCEESLPGIEKILDDKVTTPLGRVNGVGSVTVYGAPAREIQVYCDPYKLAAYGLDITTISSIITYENQNVPSGSIDIGSSTFNLRIEKEFDDPSEILDIVLKSDNGQVVYLRDVATVYDGLEEKSQESYTNGGRSAAIMVQKQTGANSVGVIRSVFKELESIQKTLPPDVQITTVIDSSENILNSIRSLVQTIIITLIVVCIVVFVFLGRWRATFIIVLAIPLSLLGSLVYLYATGATLNLMSLASLSIAIGMVVDDAIVVIENVSTHLERGERPVEAAVHGTSEMGISVIGTTLTMLCVFMPLTLVTGVTGILFKQIGWIVSIIMIISTTSALTLVPMLSSVLLSNKPKTGKFYKVVFGPINRFLDALSNGYSRLISWCVTHRRHTVLGAFVVFCVILYFLGRKVETEYFPHMDQGRLSVTIEFPISTQQEVTGAFAKEFEARLREEIPEIQVLQMQFGEADTDNSLAAMQSNGSYYISMNINIGSVDTRKRGVSDIAQQIRDALDEYPELKRYSVTEGQGGMGGASTVELEIYGYDFEETDEAARAIQAIMKESPIFTEATLSRDEYKPEYQVDFDRTKLALNGLNSTTAASAFAAAMSGSVGSYYREDGEEYDIRVRYAKEFRSSTEDIEDMIVYNAAGQAVRMKDLGTIIETEVPPTIERKNRERYITVTGIVSKGYSLSKAVEATQAAIDQVDLPTTLTTVIAGDYEDQQDVFGTLITLMVMIVILVYMVMASQFESFMSPFVIMFSIPFAFTGVIIGLVLTGTPLGIMGMIGLLILIGIVVKNGIVLIDYINLQRERGLDVISAAVVAARSRLRPILMTTLTTVLGMLPMAIGIGEGSEMWMSLGLVVCWGLSISTLVTLFLIPTIYCVFAFRSERRARRKAIEASKK